MAGLLVAVVSLAIVLWAASYLWPRSQIVYEHQRALRYRKGRMIGELGPGRYWLRPRTEELRVVDVRRRLSVVAGQEVLTADRVPIKVSLVAEYTVADLRKALTVVEKFRETLYAAMQLALRRAVAARDLDTTLAERGEIGEAVASEVRAEASEFGVELHTVQVRDFMMAGGLRNAYAEVVQARQQGLAALERARGESAAIRNLTNAAQLMERHPGIVQLRLLQAVETGTGNRVVIALDPERGRTSNLTVEAEGG